MESLNSYSENPLIKTETIHLPKSDPSLSISNLIPLTDTKIWIYFYSGLSQYWDLSIPKTPTLINSMKLPKDIFHTFALSPNKIAFYDHKSEKLRIILLPINKIDDNFWVTLPTANAIEENKRQDESKIQEISRDYSRFCVLLKNETIVLLEASPKNPKESIISVFNEMYSPDPFRQSLVQATSMSCLNEEDTLVFYHLSSEYTHTFLIWNIMEEESKMKKIVIMDKIAYTIIIITDFGVGKIGVWMNMKNSGTPKVGVVDYFIEKESEYDYDMEFKSLRGFHEDWILSNVFHYDSKNGVGFVTKNADSIAFDLKKEGVLFSLAENEELNRSLSMDFTTFVDYEWEIGGDFDEEGFEKEEDSEEKAKDAKKEFKIVLNRVCLKM